MSRSYHNQDADLKQELSGQLHKAGRRSAHYLPEIRCVLRHWQSSTESR